MSEVPEIFYPDYSLTCGSCHHFYEVGPQPGQIVDLTAPKVGACRRLPPGILTVQPGSGASIYPQIACEFPSCGEHLPRKAS